MTISQDVRERAKEGYIIDGLTFDQVSMQIKVPVGTLKGWAKEDEWQKKRKEYQTDRNGFKESLSELRDKMLTKALDSLDPQDIYPLVALEKLLGMRTKAGEEPDEAADKKMTPEELMEFIRGRIYGLGA